MYTCNSSITHLEAVNGLNQPLETPSGQTSIGDCVRGMNKKIERPTYYEIPTCSFYRNSW